MKLELPEETIKCIIKDYFDNNIRGHQISKKYNLSPGKIYKTIREFGKTVKPTSRRKYIIDETMFETIDCEWKAYLLGLLYADGGISRLNVRLGLIYTDKEILEKISGITKCPIRFQNAKTYSKNGKTFNNSALYILEINSKKIVEDLIKLGCGYRKSLTLEFPRDGIIPSNLFNHFIRGYFDGDGCIQFRQFHIISSNNFCNGFQQWLLSNLNIASYLRKYKKVSRVNVHKYQDIKKIFNYLYQNATLFLERKKKKFMELYPTIG